MRVSDYVAKTLVDNGVRHVFMLTGGGSMFLNDAIGHEPHIECVFNHHEQASAMAAEGYIRITNTLGVVNVTSDPGGINILNGVYGALDRFQPDPGHQHPTSAEHCGANQLFGLAQPVDPSPRLIP
jgi:thiamine pyrophosphate-dependent acetolactate synthase large subunit-like protein